MHDARLQRGSVVIGGSWPPFTAADTCLARVTSLTDDERCALNEIGLAVRSVRPGEELVREGERTESIHFLVDGWAYRFKGIRDGRRLISRLLAPDDVCNLDALLFDTCDYGVWALTTGTIASMPRQRALELVAEHPGIARGIAWLSFQENAILARLVLCLGRQSARERVAHLLCELCVRLGCGDEGELSIELPLTQEHIADVLGLTAVHVNRTLQQLRNDGLLGSAPRRVIVPDIAALRRVADFSPNYLHIDGAVPQPASSACTDTALAERRGSAKSR